MSDSFQVLCRHPFRTLCLLPFRTLCRHLFRTLCLLPFRTLCLLPFGTLCRHPFRTLCLLPFRTLCRHPFRTLCILTCLSSPPFCPPALQFLPPLPITQSENRKENTIFKLATRGETLCLYVQRTKAQISYVRFKLIRLSLFVQWSFAVKIV